MVESKRYIFSLDYGNRMQEKEFIKDILDNFDRDSLVACAIFVNNNPYSLEFLLFLSFEKEVDRFEELIKSKYNKKKRIFNYFIEDIYNSFGSRGYNCATFLDSESVDMLISDEINPIFQFPSKNVFDTLWKSNANKPKIKRVFI